MYRDPTRPPLDQIPAPVLIARCREAAAILSAPQAHRPTLTRLAERFAANTASAFSRSGGGA